MKETRGLDLIIETVSMTSICHLRVQFCLSLQTVIRIQWLFTAPPPFVINIIPFNWRWQMHNYYHCWMSAAAAAAQPSLETPSLSPPPPPPRQQSCQSNLDKLRQGGHPCHFSRGGENQELIRRILSLVNNLTILIVFEDEYLKWRTNCWSFVTYSWFVPLLHYNEYREVEGARRVKSAIKTMSSRDRQEYE